MFLHRFFGHFVFEYSCMLAYSSDMISQFLKSVTIHIAEMDGTTWVYSTVLCKVDAQVSIFEVNTERSTYNGNKLYQF